MTPFETLANALGIELTIDEHGLYTGMAAELFCVADDIILDGDNYLLSDEELMQMIGDAFMKKFPEEVHEL